MDQSQNSDNKNKVDGEKNGSLPDLDDGRTEFEKKLNSDSASESIDYESTKKPLDVQLKTYMMPILSLLLFVGILAFVSVPAIGKVFDHIDEKGVTEAELVQKKAELKDLEKLAASQELDKKILDQLNLIIPTAKTEVVDFAVKIEEFSLENVIKIDDVIIGERILVDANQKATDEVTDLQLVQIPIQFNLAGPLPNFRDMLLDIYKSDDFIVVTKMRLDIYDDGNAEMEIVLSKYQFLPLGQNEGLLLNSVSHKEFPDQAVIDFVERKSEDLIREE